MNADKKMSVDDAKFRIQEKAKLTDDEVRYLTYYRRAAAKARPWRRISKRR